MSQTAAWMILQMENTSRFDMFDGTRMDVNHWGNVLLDGVREISMDEIDRVDSSEKTKKMPAFRIQHTRIIILTATIHSG